MKKTKIGIRKGVPQTPEWIEKRVSKLRGVKQKHKRGWKLTPEQIIRASILRKGKKHKPHKKHLPHDPLKIAKRPKVRGPYKKNTILFQENTKYYTKGESPYVLKVNKNEK